MRLNTIIKLTIKRKLKPEYCLDFLEEVYYFRNENTLEKHFLSMDRVRQFNINIDSRCTISFDKPKVNGTTSVVIEFTKELLTII